MYNQNELPTATAKEPPVRIGGLFILILETITLASGQALAEEYRRDYGRVKDLYAYNPWDSAAWELRAARRDDRTAPAADRKQVADALLAFNKKIGNANEAIRQIERLQDPRALVLTGGQQAGLFSGELLVIYKAVTILHAARVAEAKLNRPVIPVFWIAGEDHDFDEVNHIAYLNPRLETEKIVLPQPGKNRTSVSRTVIPDWEPVLLDLEASLLDTEFKTALMEKLKKIAAESPTLTEFFARMLAWQFGEQGLVLLDSDDPALRACERDFFRELLTRQPELTDALLTGRQAVERLGYAPQADVNPDGANLFLFDEETGDRILLYRKDGRFTDRRGERSFTLEELLTRLENSPQDFSNNVLTRPLMQDYLLPVLGSVLGPGELAYWGLTRSAFEAFGLDMPILIPRKSFTLIEGTVAKHMRLYDLSLADVFQRLEERKQAWLKEQDNLGIEETFALAKERLREDYRPVVELVSSINPGMAKLASVNLMKIMEQVEFLEARSTEAYRSQFDASIRQWDRIGMSLYPGGKPQERVYNLLAYLVKYGNSWLWELTDNVTEEWGEHRAVYF
ncbi:bacillithiol biosynthesis cysteine-adding enzyme BshC [Gorillibacterium timonense]|uniref:bacillithiol biosynthesis cysteine-adding enzyme BshC n=1 Tax=Gorillibacterium timonense TaxID=1689269 RepID=UPI0009EA400A|nr:bacillithiol biosynthesis cysteine-adding enzyme BshC [Gorillibacterium timonense]